MTKKDWRLLAYRDMVRIRRFEERSIELYKAGLLGGSLHLYMGQEAVAVGAMSVLRSDDPITITYRGRGHALAKGMSPATLFAEMLGRRDGCCKGKGGPMHVGDPALGVMTANAIVAGGIPIAVGLALAAKKQRTGRVALAFFGDGTVNQGAFHEALNLAAIWQLPVVFVCENNLYSEMSPIHEMVRLENLADRAGAYGIRSAVVDGMDVEAVREVMAQAVGVARAGEGPSLVEAKTYRFVGHMFGDPEVYRTPEEVKGWIQRDPIRILRDRLTANGVATEADLDAIEAEAVKEIEQASATAEKLPEPALEEALTDVF